MGLNIVVGIPAGDEHDGVREHFAVISRLLDRAGALPDPLPEVRMAAGDPLLKKAYAEPPGTRPGRLIT